MARSAGEGIPVMDNSDRREPTVISGPGIPGPAGRGSSNGSADAAAAATGASAGRITTSPAHAASTAAPNASSTPARRRGAYGVSFDGLDAAGQPTRGLTFERRWTRPGVHPYDEIAWEIRTASIGNESGKTVFEQKDVEVPAFWSQLATNVVVSKYFRGHVGTPERETSVRQL
ncbi:MAG TPA: hypothetical protein VNF73_11565, partial [Candidatus Saccharimonadales bacterium]|nr:hypothetical protein [Candidatus Saccharimonadales bacterium]